MNQKVISSRKLHNNVSITFIDNSRPIAGDRWYIEVICRAVLQEPADLWTAVPDHTPELLDCIRGRMGNQLVFSTTRKRNFIAEGDKSSIIDELISQVEENILQYINNPTFRRKLFARNYQAARARCLAAETRPQATAEFADGDDGPSDFSHLFK
jgi:hypothetical protein